MEVQIVSAIQFNPRLARCRADVKDNFRKIRPLIEQAGNLGSSFLVLPELCLTGYSFMDKEEAFEVAELDDGPTFQVMQRCAVEMDCYISWGYIEIDRESGDLYNSASMVSPSGELVTSYRKINLYSSDFLWAKPGLHPAPIIQTPFGETSIIICRDIRNEIPKNIPRVASKATHFGGERVDMVAACTNWGSGGGYPPTNFMEFVGDNHCTMVVADRWGKEEVNGFTADFGTGKTAVISSSWKVHTNGLLHGEDCVVTAIL